MPKVIETSLEIIIDQQANIQVIIHLLEPHEILHATMLRKRMGDLGRIAVAGGNI